MQKKYFFVLVFFTIVKEEGILKQVAQKRLCSEYYSPTVLTRRFVVASRDDLTGLVFNGDDGFKVALCPVARLGLDEFPAGGIVVRGRALKRTRGKCQVHPDKGQRALVVGRRAVATGQTLFVIQSTPARHVHGQTFVSELGLIGQTNRRHILVDLDGTVQFH